MKNCISVNVPTVDNTQLPCSNPITSNCVFQEDPILFIGTTTGDSQDTVNKALVDRIITQQRELNNLKLQISGLISTISTLSNVSQDQTEAPVQNQTVNPIQVVQPEDSGSDFTPS